jgi:hypothetical protein
MVEKENNYPFLEPEEVAADNLLLIASWLYSKYKKFKEKRKKRKEEKSK